jgi:hypothetical protein
MAGEAVSDALLFFLPFCEQLDRLNNPALSSLLALCLLNPTDILFLMSVGELPEERPRFRMTFQCLSQLFGDGNFSWFGIFFQHNLYLLANVSHSWPWPAGKPAPSQPYKTPAVAPAAPLFAPPADNGIPCYQIIYQMLTPLAA